MMITKSITAVLRLVNFFINLKMRAFMGDRGSLRLVIGRRIYWLSLLLMLSLPALAQKELKVADLHFQRYEYALAVENYKKAVSGKAPSVAVARKIADCYRLMNKS